MNKRKSRTRRWGLLSTVVVLTLLFSGVSGGAQEGGGASEEASSDDSVVITNTEPQAALAHWTSDRLASAEPYPMPVLDGSEAEVSELTAGGSGVPGLVTGSGPGEEEQAGQMFVGAEAEKVAGVEQQLHPRDPIADYPPPGNRTIVNGKFRSFPNLLTGKLFFSGSSANPGNFVCSAGVQFAPVENRNRFDLLLTAGHCLHDGGNGSAGWHSNFLFCPGYNQQGAHPDWGCWSWTSASVPSQWFNNGDIELDWGGIATPATSNTGFDPGGTNPDRGPGNVTGRLGYAWNWFEVADVAHGYPAGPPYNGGQLIQCASVEWYRVNWTAWPDNPKYMGCDMTGGSSGGPWIFRWGKTNTPNGGQGAVGNFTNGVNSHRRIISDPCSGLCTREMGSPAFTDRAGGAKDFIENVLATLP